MQRVIGIIQGRLQRHVARDGVHHGINRSQCPFELAPCKRVGTHGHFQTFRQLREILFRQRKIDIHGIESGERDNLLAGIDHLANIHLANAKLSVKRRDNRFLRDAGAHLIHDCIHSREFRLCRIELGA